jgi:hypothetical protein
MYLSDWFQLVDHTLAKVNECGKDLTGKFDTLETGKTASRLFRSFPLRRRESEAHCENIVCSGLIRV